MFSSKNNSYKMYNSSLEVACKKIKTRSDYKPAAIVIEYNIS